MKEQYGKKEAIITVSRNVVLVLFGLTIALGLVEFLMRTFPNWVPPGVRVNPPTRRVKAFIDETYVLRQSDGDLFTSERAVPELARQHMDDQADLLADFAAEHNINYLDLTPTFKEEAGTGAELYYLFDTHWNQRGHDLAARTIALYLEVAQ